MTIGFRTIGPHYLLHGDVRIAAIAAATAVQVVVNVRRTADDGPAARGENLLKRLSKLEVEYGVDDGVERTVRIAEPGEHFEDDGRNARLAEGRHDVDAKERHPTDEEDAHNDAQRDGRLVVGHVVCWRVALLGRTAGRLDVAGFGQVGRLALEPAQCRRPRRRLDVLHVHACVKVQTRVDGQHDEARKIERDARRNDGVGRRQVQRALSPIHSENGVFCLAFAAAAAAATASTTAASTAITSDAVAAVIGFWL